jgi:ABC-2 type transport system permease protein
MRAWLAVIGSSFRQRLAYRANVVYAVLWLLLTVFIQLTIWRALYGGRDAIAGASLTDMATYVVIVNLVRLSGAAYGATLIEERVKSGDIVTDLLKPMDYRTILLFENVGSSLFNYLFSGLPLIAASVLFLRLAPPASPAHLAAFLGSVAGSFLISLCLEFVKSPMAFWAMRPGTMEWVFDGLDLVFGGGMIPLWLFPPFLSGIANALPFRMTQYVPAALYLGRIGVAGIGWVLIQQALWIAGLLCLQEILWRRGVRRVTVYGG